jgi:hypothetical protein
LRKRRAAQHAQLTGRWLGVLVFWGLVGAYPACSGAEFKASGQAGSAGGGRGGSGGSNGGSSGRDASESDSEAEASAGRGGSAGTGSGGSAGTLPEAGPDTGDARADTSTDAPSDAPRDAPADAPPTCDAPLQYFLDADHDTYGDDSTTRRACTAPGGDWVLRGGDCRDDLPEVRPNQTNYMPEGYETTEGESFDYNCSGLEEPDPGSFGAAPASCPLLPPCGNAAGYVPGPRSGPGVNALCGSQLLRGCVTNGALCVQQQAATTVAKRCR